MIMLVALVMLGIVYGGLLSSRRTLTGIHHLDGIIGVVLGLYICSRPAANLVDMLFYRRYLRYPFLSNRFVVFWLALNTLVLLMGAIVIFIGTTRFISGTD